jgi:hypothetical protein
VLDAVAVGVAGEEGCDVRRLGAQLRERPGRRVAPRRRHHGAGPRAARGNALSFPAVSAARGSCPAPCTAPCGPASPARAAVAVVQAPHFAAGRRRRPSYERRALRRVRQLASFTAPRRVPAPPPVSAVR